MPEQQNPSLEPGNASQLSDLEANALYRTSYTSQRASAVFFTIMLASFVILLILLQVRSLAHPDAAQEMVTRSTSSPVPMNYQLLDSTSRTYQMPIDSAMQAVVRHALQAPSTAPSSRRLPN